VSVILALNVTGALNFALAFVALFSVLSTLGLEGIVVRDIVHDPSCRDETLASAFFLKLIGSGVTLILALAVIAVIRPNESIYRTLVGIAAAATVFQRTRILYALKKESILFFIPCEICSDCHASGQKSPRVSL